MDASQILALYYPLTSELIETASAPVQPFLREEAEEAMLAGRDDREIHMFLADALVEFEG